MNKPLKALVLIALLLPCTLHANQVQAILGTPPLSSARADNMATLLHAVAAVTILSVGVGVVWTARAYAEGDKFTFRLTRRF